MRLFFCDIFKKKIFFKSLGTTGIITGVDHDFDFEVTYPSGNKWIFNPAVLTYASSERANHLEAGLDNQTFPDKIQLSQKASLFSLNDRVQISSDKEYLQRVQKGHGEWIDDMDMVLIL